jgi:hypothetical protein
MSAVTFEVVSESLVEALPDVVWAMLTRFDRYGDWTRSLQIAGDVRRGPELAYIVPTVRADGSVRHFTLDGRIEVVTPERALVWSVRLSIFLTLRFRFDLTPTGEGCCLGHSVEGSGLLASMVRGPLTLQFGPVVRQFVADAAKAAPSIRCRHAP